MTDTGPRHYTEVTMNFEIACVEDVIENEIAQGLSQKQIAQTYALGLRSAWPTDWRRVNEAILKQWKAAGLARIKRLAWSGKCFDRKKTA